MAEFVDRRWGYKFGRTKEWAGGISYVKDGKGCIDLNDALKGAHRVSIIIFELTNLYQQDRHDEVAASVLHGELRDVTKFTMLRQAIEYDGLRLHREVLVELQRQVGELPAEMITWASSNATNLTGYLLPFAYDYFKTQGASSHTDHYRRLFEKHTVEAKQGRAFTRKPDILLLMPDQMRGDCLSALGHPVVRTPQLDELARQGVLFRRAYSTVPSCIPARYALLTGTSPQVSGVVGYGARPITTPTLPRLLADAGYATVLVGRNMHQLPKSGACGYQKQILGSTYVADDDYDADLKKAAPESGGIRNVIGKLGLNCNLWPAAPWPLADELHPTAWVVQQSRQIVDAAPASKPLFLTASFYAPHPPLFPPKKFFDALLKKDLPRPAHGDWVDWAALSPTGDRQGHRVRLEGETLQRAQAGYFGLIEHLDEQVGPLIASFKARSEKAGCAWVIVLTSDHGEMLGDHGYFRKCEPYEGSANIPFIIAGSPSLGFKPGGRCVQPACLEDILPTLVELTHVSRPKSADGVSLVPMLRGTDRVAREWLHFEHAPCYGPAQAFHALTDGHFKYIWRPADGAEQLFDLDRDPREEHDLSKFPATQQWRQRLIQRLAGRPEGFSDGQHLIAARPYPAVQKK